MNQAEQLEQGLVALGIVLPASVQAKLLAYVALLYKWNKTYSLTALREQEKAVSHHLLDSLAILPFITAGSLLDVGSGGGMPGIPLAIARPELRVTLLDSNSKKAAFLQQAAIELGLPNISVHGGRVEQYHPAEGFTAITSRAFAELADFVALSQHLLAPDGRWLAMKGLWPHDEIARLPALAQLDAVHRLDVPGVDGERHLVVLRRADEQADKQVDEASGGIELAKILAVTNQKGGVGKTTTAVNLSACLASLGQRVLMIDLDPQGNATTGCGVVKRVALPTVYQILIGRSTLAEARIHTEFGFDILPANRELAGAEVEMIEMGGREFRLRDALAPVIDDYDFVLMDCPPALNMLTVNGLVAAEAVMIPMQCEYYALEGLTDLVATLKKVRANLNSKLEIEGLLRTLFDPRSTLTQQVSGELVEHFGAKVYQTIIPRNVRLAEAPSYGKPVIAFDRQSKGAQAYMALAQEMLDRRDGVVRQAAEVEQGADA